jgi:hypothetical protein
MLGVNAQVVKAAICEIADGHTPLPMSGMTPAVQQACAESTPT